MPLLYSYLTLAGFGLWLVEDRTGPIFGPTRRRPGAGEPHDVRVICSRCGASLPGGWGSPAGTMPTNLADRLFRLHERRRAVGELCFEAMAAAVGVWRLASPGGASTVWSREPRRDRRQVPCRSEPGRYVVRCVRLAGGTRRHPLYEGWRGCPCRPGRPRVAAAPGQIGRRKRSQAPRLPSLPGCPLGRHGRADGE
jgi:hypothetical protein